MLRVRLRMLAGALCVLACACQKPVGSQADTRRAGHAPAPSASASAAIGSGRTLELQARHESGVPLHGSPGSGSVIARLADGSKARLEGQSADGRWYEVSQGSVRGWITRRYVVGATSSARAPRSALPEDSPFASKSACAAALAAAERLPRNSGQERIASWNLHWFPDGKPGKGDDSELGTDVEWLACTMAWLDASIVALQELKSTTRARAKLDELVTLLDRNTHGSWHVALDDCPERAGQHVGLLYDEQRAKRLSSATVAELNPHGSPCKDQLRPGLDAYLRFRGGLDLHVISAHLKAGGQRRDLELRERSYAAFSEAYARAQELAADSDVLVIGDLNTLGCPDCSPPLPQDRELALLDQRLASEGFERLRPDLGCSMYYGEKPSLLDGATASLGFRELGRGAKLHVSGLCAELGCRSAPPGLSAHERLSDHCPVYVDVDDRDQD